MVKERWLSASDNLSYVVFLIFFYSDGTFLLWCSNYFSPRLGMMKFEARAKKGPNPQAWSRKRRPRGEDRTMSGCLKTRLRGENEDKASETHWLNPHPCRTSRRSWRLWHSGWAIYAPNDPILNSHGKLYIMPIRLSRFKNHL